MEDSKNKYSLIFERELVAHSAGIDSVICFEGCIISGGNDHRVFIWDEAGNVLKEIKDHTSYINAVIMLNSDVFLTCSSDKKIFSYSTRKPWNMIKRFENNETKVYDIIRLNDDDLFMSCNHSDELFVYSHSQGEVIRSLQKQGSYYSISICLSPKYQNIMYFNTISNVLKKIDYIKDLEEVLIDHSNNNVYGAECNCIFAYLNKRNIELIILAMEEKIGVFESSKKDNFILAIDSKESLGSYHGISIFNQKYLYGTTSRGLFDLLEINFDNYDGSDKNDLRFKRVLLTIIKEGNGTKINDVKVCSKGSNFFELVVGRSNNNVQIFKVIGVEGLGQKDKESKMDLKERINFIFENKDEYIFKNSESSDCKVYENELILDNNNFGIISRVLFLM